MNTIAKILAPVALVAASFGAQASQLSPGDLGTRAVTAGPAVATQVVAPAGYAGEVSPGDIGFRSIVAGAPVERQAAPTQRVRIVVSPDLAA